MSSLTKKNLRKEFLKSRLSLSNTAWREKSDRLCQNLENSTLLKQARCILAYFSFRQEPDLTPLFSLCSCEWGFSRSQGDKLVWHHWQKGEPLEKNGYGILEPCACAPVIEPEQVDLILIPALACDRRGYRLGYGGGFYDRLLADKAWHQIPTLGIIFAFAYVEELPVEPWDQRLGGICTEEELIFRNL